MSFIIIGLSFTLSSAQNIKGITVVSPPSAFKIDPYPRILETNVEWIGIVPYGFCQQNSTKIVFNLQNQWWGEKEEGVIESIKLAKAKGLKIFLKPQIYVSGSWPGNINFKTDEEWQEWENDYKDFIFTFLEIAEKYDVELFCLGTEFKISAMNRVEFWRQLIKDAKKIYSGKLTYSSNWDVYNKIVFWDELDFIGISAYFPLVNQNEPSIPKIKRAWKPIIKELNKLSKKFKKPYLFTEYGYLSVDRCTFKNWELEKEIFSLSVNEKAQADAFEALFSSFWDQKNWAGGFLWKWFPNNKGHEGYIKKDYTPKDKLAEDVLKRWFK